MQISIINHVIMKISLQVSLIRFIQLAIFRLKNDTVKVKQSFGRQI